MSYGGAPKAAIAMGQNDNKTAERIMGNCLVLLVAAAAVLTALVLAFSEPLLYFFGASSANIGYANEYLRIYALGTLFVQLSLGMNAFITTQGFSTFGMLTVAIGAVCNIVLDPVFMFGFGLGVAGAAWATILSQFISSVFVLWFLRSRRTILKLRLPNLRPSLKIMGASIALGLSPFTMQFTESVLFICFNRSLRTYGGDLAVGAMTILSSVMQFSMLPLQGLTQGSQPLVSYNFGAGKTAASKRPSGCCSFPAWPIPRRCGRSRCSPPRCSPACSPTTPSCWNTPPGRFASTWPCRSSSARRSPASKPSWRSAAPASRSFWRFCARCSCSSRSSSSCRSSSPPMPTRHGRVPRRARGRYRCRVHHLHGVLLHLPQAGAKGRQGPVSSPALLSPPVVSRGGFFPAASGQARLFSEPLRPSDPA